MRAVLFDIWFGGADDNVKVHTNVGMAEPRRVVGGETDGVVACFMRGESEPAVEGSDGLYDDVPGGFFLDWISARVG